MSEENSAAALIKRETVDIVAARVRQFIEGGELHLPPNYSAENALKSAWLQIQQTTDKDKRPVLQVCSRESVANALLDMVVQGLNPAKRQCYWIAYGTTLTCQRSYFGTIHLARLSGGVRDVWAEVVYEGDEFAFELCRGGRKITRHVQALESVRPDKMRAAYAVVEFEGGRPEHVEIMTMDQIRRSWSKSRGNPEAEGGVHRQFPDQMCKRTVIVRALKTIINSSADDWLLADALQRQDASAVLEVDAAEAELGNGPILDIEPQPQQPARAAYDAARSDAMRDVARKMEGGLTGAAPPY